MCVVVMLARLMVLMFAKFTMALPPLIPVIIRISVIPVTVVVVREIIITITVIISCTACQHKPD